MAAERGLFLFLAIFQLAGVLLLSRAARGAHRVPVNLLRALLLLNGALAAIVIFDPQRTHPVLWPLTLVLDAPTGALILAYGLWVAGARRAAWAAIGLAGATLVLGALRPALVTSGPVYWSLVPVVYYVGQGVLLWACARADDPRERWVALAFLPRAVFFVMYGVNGVREAAAGADAGLGPLLYSLLGVSLLAPIGYAVVRMTRAPAGPPLGVVVGALALGPADFVALMWVDAATPLGSLAAQFLNFLTLALVRPLLLYIAFEPHAIVRVLGRAALASGLGTFVFAVGPGVGFHDVSASIVGVSLAGLALLAIEATTHAQAHPLAVEEPRRPAPEGPHWSLILLHLHAAGAGDGGPPQVAWTQKGIAEATGISVKRVSEFPDHVNETASQRLDAFVPDWRSRFPPASALVTVHRGSIQGLMGSRVFYRLTPAGCATAIRLREASVDPSSPIRAP